MWGGPWRPHKLRLFSTLLTPLFNEHSHRVFGVLLFAISESCDTDFAGQIIYKPWVLTVSSEALMSITTILIPATYCLLLLHQLVIVSVIVPTFNVMVFKYTHYIKCFANWVYCSNPAGIRTKFAGLASQFSTH